MTMICFIDLIVWLLQEYAPVHDTVAPRQSWEVDQLLESTRTGREQAPGSSNS